MEAAGGLVGRQPELTHIEELIEGARSARSGVLALRGEPGIGKSALLRAARSLAGDDMTVLATTGSEGESEIPYAALHSLMAPVLDRLFGNCLKRVSTSSLAQSGYLGVVPFATRTGLWTPQTGGVGGFAIKVDDLARVSGVEASGAAYGLR